MVAGDDDFHGDGAAGVSHHAGDFVADGGIEIVGNGFLAGDGFAGDDAAGAGGMGFGRRGRGGAFAAAGVGDGGGAFVAGGGGAGFVQEQLRQIRFHEQGGAGQVGAGAFADAAGEVAVLAGGGVVGVGAAEGAGLERCGEALVQHFPVAQPQPQVDVAGEQIPEFVDGEVVAGVGAVPDAFLEPAGEGGGRQGVDQQFVGQELLQGMVGDIGLGGTDQPPAAGVVLGFLRVGLGGGHRPAVGVGQGVFEGVVGFFRLAAALG